MPQTTNIQSEWIEQLFQNENFTTRLKSFIKQQQLQPTQVHPQTSSPQVIDQLSSQITQLMSQHLIQQIQLRTQTITQQISKINNEIGILKNYMFGSCEKLQLESTCYNRSKLQLSSILQQDVGVDIVELKSALTEVQQRMNYWFGNHHHSQKLLNLQQNSKLAVQINTKCNEIVTTLDAKVKQRFQSSDQLFQKRIQLISKTLNNVLEMINQNPIKDEFKDQFAEKGNLKQKQSTNTNSNSILRQSSLQNMKLKSFFSFGKR